MRIQTALEYASPSNPVCLIGAPGIGKSAIVEQWAGETGREIVIEHPVIAQSVDYRGLPAVTEGCAEWLPIGTLRHLCEPGRPAVLFLDDVGQAPAPVQAALMQIVWARRIGDAVLRENVTNVLASNRVTDRSAVRPLLAALVGRVQMCPVEMPAESWSEWAATQKEVPPTIAAYPRFRPDCFAASVPEDPMSAYCTPRSLYQAGVELVGKGCQNLDLIAGWIGQAAAADWLNYSKTVAQLPSIDDLLAQPNRLKTKDPGLLHAVVVMAAHAAEREPAKVLALGDHMGAAWAVATASAAAGVWPSFKKTDAFRTWAVRHKELL